MNMKLLLANGLCGMTPRQGSIVGGLYFIMVGIMQFVFEMGHFRMVTEYNAGLALINSISNVTMNNPPIPWASLLYFYSLLTLESLTLVLVLVLLMGVWHQRVRIILGMAVGLVLFDVAVVILVTLLQVEIGALGHMLRPLEWYSIAFRLLGDPFWLSFVFTYGLQIQQEESHVGSRSKRCGSVTSLKRVQMKMF